MQTVATVAEVRARVAAARAAGMAVGLVPTMGAFHEGHLSLIRRARADGGLAVVSIFVNPTQFAPGEDYSRYPRDTDRDARLAAEAGTDLLFVPSVEEIYPPGFSTSVTVEGLDTILEGAIRPGHYRGVCTVVARLFGIVTPDRACFGQKDYQQLRIVERMARDLNLPVTIVPMPTVREADGLAMSSRNTYLSAEERVQARVLSRALREAEASVAAGDRDAAALEARATATICSAPLATLDYTAVRDAATLEVMKQLDRPAVLLVAARFGATRLIDNVLLLPDGNHRRGVE
jgi:pantoate--beta-alanine ligase